MFSYAKVEDEYGKTKKEAALPERKYLWNGNGRCSFVFNIGMFSARPKLREILQQWF